MEAWIILAVAAAAFQTLRFMLQKHLSRGRVVRGRSHVRAICLFGPRSWRRCARSTCWTGAGPPRLTALFWVFALGGGLAQVLATWCVVALFAQRNFAVGITFKKTEVVQTALVGVVVLGDTVSAPALAAIVLGLGGVLVLSDMPRSPGCARGACSTAPPGWGLPPERSSPCRQWPIAVRRSRSPTPIRCCAAASP